MKAPKIGTIYHHLYIDGDTGEHSWDIYAVSCIRSGRVHCILKDSTTWVKISKKQGDYGWAKGIPDYNKYSFLLEEGRPDRLAISKKGALRAAVKSYKNNVQRLKKYYPDEEFNFEMVEKKLKTLKARLR